MGDPVLRPYSYKQRCREKWIAKIGTLKEDHLNTKLYDCVTCKHTFFVL